MVRRVFIIRIFALLLLLLGGMEIEMLAYKVTYRILTLPLNHSTGTKNTKSQYDGKRTEAIKAIADNASKVGDLPAHFKSPLAHNFAYIDPSFISNTGTNKGKQAIYQNNSTNYILYGLNIGDGNCPILPYIKVTVGSAAVSAIVESTKSEWESAAASSQKTATTKTAFDTIISGISNGDY